ncbi:hypothetical protein [Streptomyces microflavus]|uniref:hypothetical protein n=1 Tax=Streptomyces microflavus TaxID=1919 RepID=UPI003656D7D1
MISALPAWSAEALAAAVVVLLVGWWTWRKVRDLARRTTPAVCVAALAAAACTGYSADTSWRFAAHYLDMGSAVERAAMFGAAELALFATALMARQNLNGTPGAPGAPGALVWLITGVQIIPAYAESGFVGGTVRAFVGPVMAAVLWHLAMGIELRHHKPDAESRSVTAVLGRELRERLLSRLGLALRDRDAAQISRDRATTRAVALAARLAEMTPDQRGKRGGRRLARKLAAAVDRASVGMDPDQRQRLLVQLAARRHASALATVNLPSPWDGQAPDPVASALAAQTREQMRKADRSIREHGRSKLLFADIGAVRKVDTESRSPEHEPVEKLDTAEAQAAIEAGWRVGLTVRETARRATRAPSYVHSVFVKLDDEHGPRSTGGQLALVNGRGAEQLDIPDPEQP